jgi:hypothetical protein
LRPALWREADDVKRWLARIFAWRKRLTLLLLWFVVVCWWWRNEVPLVTQLAVQTNRQALIREVTKDGLLVTHPIHSLRNVDGFPDMKCTGLVRLWDFRQQRAVREVGDENTTYLGATVDRRELTAILERGAV